MNAKIAVGVVVIAGVMGYVAYLGASSSWRYYLLVDELAAQSDRIGSARLRVSGQVVVGSLVISDNRRRATFVLGGTESEVAVIATGPLPDNLADGMEVVVEGSLESHGKLHADRVITRCASKYAAKNAPIASQPRSRSDP
jgi:cytochrome c-type biogenesis protein CcmE